MGEHLVDGEFQSDKYTWCKPGFVPLKLTDPMAQPLLYAYAQLRAVVDQEFANDLITALELKGFAGSSKHEEVTEEIGNLAKEYLCS